MLISNSRSLDMLMMVRTSASHHRVHTLRHALHNGFQVDHRVHEDGGGERFLVHGLVGHGLVGHGRGGHLGLGGNLGRVVMDIILIVSADFGRCDTGRQPAARSAQAKPMRNECMAFYF